MLSSEAAEERAPPHTHTILFTGKVRNISQMETQRSRGELTYMGSDMET